MDCAAKWLERLRAPVPQRKQRAAFLESDFPVPTGGHAPLRPGQMAPRRPPPEGPGPLPPPPLPPPPVRPGQNYPPPLPVLLSNPRGGGWGLCQGLAHNSLVRFFTLNNSKVEPFPSRLSWFCDHRARRPHAPYVSGLLFVLPPPFRHWALGRNPVALGGWLCQTGYIFQGSPSLGPPLFRSDPPTPQPPKSNGGRPISTRS